MPNPIKINLYAPLGNGGPTAWARDLAQASILSSKKDLQIFIHQSLGSYLSQPFRKGICHSTLPFLLKPKNQKYILTIHGNFYLGTDIWARLYPRAILIADIVTLPSRFLKDELIKEAGIKGQNLVAEKLNKAVIIPNGVLPVQFISAEQVEIAEKHITKSTEKKFTVGIMTNFNFPQKAEGIIKLTKILANTKLPIHILIAGDGLLKAKIEQQVIEIIKKYSNIECQFLGHIKKELFFPQIDIFTYYSNMDNQPLALMEAMTTGIPVITNSVGAVHEVLTDEALAPYICGTDEQYEKMIIKLLQSKEARKANVQACQESIEAFYWDNIISQWTKLYASISA